MLKNKVGKLKIFTVDYSILKNNKIINNSIVMQSINDPDEIVRLAKLIYLQKKEYSFKM